MAPSPIHLPRTGGFTAKFLRHIGTYPMKSQNAIPALLIGMSRSIGIDAAYGRGLLSRQLHNTCRAGVRFQVLYALD